MPIEWNRDFETGETRVDKQHQRLFEYVNELHDMITVVKGGHVLDAEKVGDLLFHLESYVTVHFAYEEMCMGIRRCPLAHQNKEAHDKLIAFYGEFLAQAKQNLTLDMLITLESTLVSWLKGHICKVDMDIRNVQPTTHYSPSRPGANSWRR